MKKLAANILCVILALCLCACGETKEEKISAEILSICNRYGLEDVSCKVESVPIEYDFQKGYNLFNVEVTCSGFTSLKENDALLFCRLLDSVGENTILEKALIVSDGHTYSYDIGYISTEPHVIYRDGEVYRTYNKNESSSTSTQTPASTPKPASDFKTEAQKYVDIMEPNFPDMDVEYEISENTLNVAVTMPGMSSDDLALWLITDSSAQSTIETLVSVAHQSCGLIYSGLKDAGYKDCTVLMGVYTSDALALVVCQNNEISYTVMDSLE